jgi:site-specific DNA recombinase
MLQNEKYRGRHIWNKTKVVQNPRKGRKEQAPRPESEWVTIDKPEWRIISDELWAAKDAANALRRDKYNGRQSGGMNRTKSSRLYMFSGLLFCDVCGGKMAITAGKGDKARYGCYSRRNRGVAICANSSSILKRQLESQLCNALALNLSDPRLRKELSHEFHTQLSAALEAKASTARQIHGQRSELKAKLGELKKEEENIVDAIAKTGGLPVLFTRLQSLSTQREQVTALLAMEDQATTLPPVEEIEAFLDRKANDLTAVISGDPFRAKQELQKRVKQLRLRPVQTPDGVTFEVTGDVRLFAPNDVLEGTSVSLSSLQYNSCTLPFRTWVFQNLGWSQARAAKRAA